MYLITVIPIGRGMSKDTLTYFTSMAVVPGSLVKIPLRRQSVFGLVVKSESAEQKKSEIKSLSFSIKKIDTVESHSFLSPAFIAASEKIADYYATTVGAVLSVLIPRSILESSASREVHVSATCCDTKTETEKKFQETFIFQSDDEDRFARYKTIVREEFAKGRSVFVILPSIEEIKNSEETLKKGIETYTYALHAGLNKKEIVRIWNSITSLTHPVLIIATGTFLSIPRTDIGTIIVEKESSRAYNIAETRPYLDIRTVAKIFSKTSSTRLIFGDSLLRIETLWKEKNSQYDDNYVPLSPLTFRAQSQVTPLLVPMYIPKDFKNEKFSVLSAEVKILLKEARANNESTFLFCGRKGLSPTTVCSDCGTVVACIQCTSPVVLYTGKIPVYVCNHCGERRPADIKCVHCGGWRLAPLGIGTEKVAQEVEELFATQTGLIQNESKKIMIMDRDHVTTHLKAVKMRDYFYTTPGAIMIGTEMAIPFLHTVVPYSLENSVVVSLDAFFAIPDFRIREKIFHILLDLRAISKKRFIVQTRQKETHIFEQALSGNLTAFYTDEIEDRKQTNYPPFSTLIKLGMRGDKKAVEKHMAEVVAVLAPQSVSVFPSWKTGTLYTLNGMLTLPVTETATPPKSGAWIDRELLGKLRSLSPNISIKIDPDTLL